MNTINVNADRMYSPLSRLVFSLSGVLWGCDMFVLLVLLLAGGCWVLCWPCFSESRGSQALLIELKLLGGDDSLLVLPTSALRCTFPYRWFCLPSGCICCLSFCRLKNVCWMLDTDDGICFFYYAQSEPPSVTVIWVAGWVEWRWFFSLHVYVFPCVRLST